MPEVTRCRQGETRIEFPSAGMTYSHQEYGVYHYSVYTASSVLEGQTRREFLDSFGTLADARSAYPAADYVPEAGSGYTPPSLDHLSNDGDL